MMVTHHWYSWSLSLLHSIIFPALKQPRFIFFTMLKEQRLLNNWKLCTTWIIIFCNVGEKSTSTFFHARLMCALLFSLVKCKNYQRTNLQNKINCFSFLFLSQIQQLFRFSFHLLEQIEITYWNFLAFFYKPNEQV